jgi:hypothetical protein
MGGRDFGGRLLRFGRSWTDENWEKVESRR